MRFVQVRALVLSLDMLDYNRGGFGNLPCRLEREREREGQRERMSVSVSVSVSVSERKRGGKKKDERDQNFMRDSKNAGTSVFPHLSSLSSQIYSLQSIPLSIVLLRDGTRLQLYCFYQQILYPYRSIYLDPYMSFTNAATRSRKSGALACSTRCCNCSTDALAPKARSGGLSLDTT
jgi:hypothetical protein